MPELCEQESGEAARLEHGDGRGLGSRPSIWAQKLERFASGAPRFVVRKEVSGDPCLVPAECPTGCEGGTRAGHIRRAWGRLGSGGA